MSDRRFNNESTIEGIAVRTADDLGLRNRKWSCADERREFLKGVAIGNAVWYGWNDAERDYFASCFDEEVAKCVEHHVFTPQLRRQLADLRDKANRCELVTPGEHALADCVMQLCSVIGQLAVNAEATIKDVA